MKTVSHRRWVVMRLPSTLGWHLLWLAVWPAVLAVALWSDAATWADRSLTVAAATGQASPVARPERATPVTGQTQASTPSPVYHLREGAEMVDQLGSFQSSGDRLVFVTRPANGRLVVLENLNLERITQILTERPQGVPWKVTGTVTEFRGTNFLLIHRANLGGSPLLDSHPRGSMMRGRGG